MISIDLVAYGLVAMLAVGLFAGASAINESVETNLQARIVEQQAANEAAAKQAEEDATRARNAFCGVQK